MFTLYCTKKLLDRIGRPVTVPEPASTHLGNWYATALLWKPQMALMVNERTLLPVLLPLAPAALAPRVTQTPPVKVPTLIGLLEGCCPP
ncbi:MAG: hypothetical protein EBR45_11645 [Betaproteobacteria bacterium]|nr:hypothetical protein [Betaproteobacteria bacterium]